MFSSIQVTGIQVFDYDTFHNPSLFSHKQEAKIREAQQELYKLLKRRSPNAIAASQDFLKFRQYVCGHETFEHMMTWHHELNTGQDNKYLRGIAGEDVCILAPRNSAKSSFLLQWVAYIIGTHAMQGISLKILYISYAVDAAIGKSRQIKAILQSEPYQEVFPLVRKSPSKWGEGEWSIDFNFAKLRTIDEAYTVVCAGLKGSINSRRCVTGDTIILTELGYKQISEIENCIGLKVLTQNDTTFKLEWKNITGFASRRTDEIFELTTSKGNILRCTPDHPIYIIGKGYRETRDLVEGDTIVRLSDAQGHRAQLSGMQYGSRKKEQKQDLQTVLEGCDGYPVRDRMQALQKSILINPSSVWTEKSIISKLLLLYFLQALRQQETSVLQAMRHQDLGQAMQRFRGKLLRELPQVIYLAKEVSRGKLRDLWQAICQDTLPPSVLLDGMCKTKSLTSYEGTMESSSYTWMGSRSSVFSSEAPSFTTRQLSMQGVQHHRRFGDPSYRSGLQTQCLDELDYSVQELPHQTSCAYPVWETDTISSVKRVHNRQTTVYDIEVEDNHNFFANGIKIHNCHVCVIDDPQKDIDEARNKSIQDRMESNYNNILKYTRYDGSRFITLGTRMAKHDAYARIFVPPYYKIITQKALLEEKQPDGSIIERSFWEPADDDSPGLRLGTLLKERQEDEESFLLQRQNELPETTVLGINTRWIKYSWMPKRFDRIVIGIDTAESMDENTNATAMVVVGISEDCLYVIDAFEGKVQGSLKKIDTIYDLWLKRKADCKHPAILAVDHHSHSLGLEGDLQSYIDDIHLDDSLDQDFANISIDKVKATGRGDKIDRLLSHSYYFEKGRVFFNLISPDVDGVKLIPRIVTQITDYNPIDHNDLMDALEVAIYVARQYITGNISVV